MGLLVTVEDQGRGIADTDGPHLFEPFYRGEQASGTRSGTGMGPPSRRGLLGGGARSRVGGKPSRGRRQVLDPGSGAESSRAGGVGRVMTRPARILLVDDEPSIQKGLTPLLASRRLRGAKAR